VALFSFLEARTERPAAAAAAFTLASGLHQLLQKQSLSRFK
jgi:hypothetical protein